MSSDNSAVGAECVLAQSAWSALGVHLLAFPHTEKFGLGIGTRRGDKVLLLATIWPKQELQSACFCEIDNRDLGIIVPEIIDARERHGIAEPVGVSAWVHTHPNLGVFLSGTDRDTFANWTEHNPALLAVVVDVFAAQGGQVKAFDAGLGEVRCTPADAGELAQGAWADFWVEIADALPNRMAEAGRPLEAMFTPVALR